MYHDKPFTVFSQNRKSGICQVIASTHSIYQVHRTPKQQSPATLTGPPYEMCKTLCLRHHDYDHLMKQITDIAYGHRKVHRCVKKTRHITSKIKLCNLEVCKQTKK